MPHAVVGPARRALATSLAVVALAACTTSPPAASPTPAAGSPEPSPQPTAAAVCDGFPERDIELVIPYSPGGGFDTWARLTAPYLAKYLPNDVSVVPTNRAGGGGLVGVTEMASAPADGYTIAITEPGLLVTQFMAETTDVDPTQLRAVGRVAVSPEVLFVSATNTKGFDDIASLQAYAQTTPAILAQGGLAAVQIVSLEALGIPYTSIFHEGSTESVLSIVRGDADLGIYTWTSMLEYVESGEVAPLVLVGNYTEEMPGADFAEEVPTLGEVVGDEGINAALEQHRLLVTTPGTPDCAVQLLSDALSLSLGDPGLIAEAAAAELVPVPVDGPGTQEIIQTTADTLESYRELILAALEEG